MKKGYVNKLLLEIQRDYNKSLQEKLSVDIDELISYMKPMKISYLIIKKLEIDKLVDKNDFENLRYEYIKNWK